jgi:phosphatidylserine/phosphatidylglycerophosphate/cardiolipin synthase-like enzyme
VLALVEGAQERLWLSAYTLSDPPLVKALAAKGQAEGFDLRIFMDAHQWEPTPELEALKASAKLVLVEVPDEGRLHAKLMLIDDKVLLGGSKNWSNLAAVRKWNDVVVVHDPKGKALAPARAFFEGLATAAAAPKLGKRVKVKGDPSNGAGEARLVLGFSAPGLAGTATRNRILDLVRGAKKRAWVAHFVVNDLQVVQQLALKAEAGVDVRFLLDGTQYANLKRRRDSRATQLKKDLERLQSAGALRVLGGQKGTGLQLHHKLAIVDDAVVTGSANCTQAAWESNYEAAVFLLPPKRSKAAPAFLEVYLARHTELWELAGD